MNLWVGWSISRILLLAESDIINTLSTMINLPGCDKFYCKATIPSFVRSFISFGLSFSSSSGIGTLFKWPKRSAQFSPFFYLSMIALCLSRWSSIPARSICYRISSFPSSVNFWIIKPSGPIKIIVGQLFNFNEFQISKWQSLTTACLTSYLSTADRSI